MSLRTIPCFIFLLHLFSFFLTPESAPAGLIINEFLPDPPGADGGREYVEIINTGPDALNLDGLALEFANGSVGPEWETRWVFEGDQWLAVGELFLLVDRNWMGLQPGDAETWLGLQNGPDAIRLFQEGEVLDLVGYGPLTDTELMEEEAASAAVGLALLRKPDGHDTDNNRMDFISGQPTPGTPNFQDFEMEVVSVVMEPPSIPDVGSRIHLEVVLNNSGLEALQPSAMVLELENIQGETTPVLNSFFAGCPDGETCSLMMVFAPPSKGRFSIFLELEVGGDGESLRLLLGRVQVGCGPVFITEVLAAPSFHQGEWLEIQAGDERINLEDFKIRDEEGGWHDLPAVLMEPGQFALIAQDSTALENWHHENLMQGLVLDCSVGQLNQSLREMPGSWPSLNNSSPEGRTYADRVYLADNEGDIDHVTIPGDDTAADFGGISWERMSHDSRSLRWGRWRPSVAIQGGTPGCPNSVAMEGEVTGNLKVEPAVLDALQGQTVVHIRFLLQGDEVGWHVEIYDLWGGLVRDLGGGETGTGPGDLIWDGRDDRGNSVSRGGYVVLLLKSHEDRNFSPSAKHLVVVR